MGIVQAQNGALFAYNEDLSLYAFGFNKDLRSEINIYSVDKGLIVDDDKQKRGRALKLVEKISFTKEEKLIYAGFVTAEDREEENASTTQNIPRKSAKSIPVKSKRKHDSEEANDDISNDASVAEKNKSLQYFLIALQNGTILVYKVSARYIETTTTIKRKANIQSITYFNNQIFVLDDTHNVESYSIFNPKSLKKFKLDNKNTSWLIHNAQQESELLQVSEDPQKNEILINSIDKNSGKGTESKQVSVANNTVKATQISLIHDDLVYILPKDNAYIYVYSKSSNSIINKLNSSDGSINVSSFEIFKIKNTEYVLAFYEADNHFEVFKCAFRKNTSNTNTALQIHFDEIPSNLSITAFAISKEDEEVVATVGENVDFVSFNISKLLSFKQKSQTVEVDIEATDTQSEATDLHAKSSDSQQPKQQKQQQQAKQEKKSKKKNQKVKSTGNTDLDKLLAVYKEVKTDNDKLIKFSIDNNYNISLIKTILKTASNEELDHLFTLLLKFFSKHASAGSDDEDLYQDYTYLKLFNWLRLIIISNGGYITKNITPKKLQLLKKFQYRVKNDSRHLNNLLNLQGKLTLLKSQYDLRNRESRPQPSSVNSASSPLADNDEDESGYLNGSNGPLNANKAHEQLLNNVIKSGDQGDAEGVQVIEEDDIIYENGEVDERNASDYVDDAEEDDAKEDEEDEDEDDL